MTGRLPTLLGLLQAGVLTAALTSHCDGTLDQEIVLPLGPQSIDTLVQANRHHWPILFNRVSSFNVDWRLTSTAVGDTAVVVFERGDDGAWRPTAAMDDTGDLPAMAARAKIVARKQMCRLELEYGPPTKVNKASFTLPWGSRFGRDVPIWVSARHGKVEGVAVRGALDGRRYAEVVAIVAQPNSPGRYDMKLHLLDARGEGAEIGVVRDFPYDPPTVGEIVAIDSTTAPEPRVDSTDGVSGTPKLGLAVELGTLNPHPALPGKVLAIEKGWDLQLDYAIKVPPVPESLTQALAERGGSHEYEPTSLVVSLSSRSGAMRPVALLFGTDRIPLQR